MRLHQQKLTLLAIFILAGQTFFTGIDWGLPSRACDAFLFGDRQPWTGGQIMTLAGAWDESAGRGADIAMRPLTARDKVVELNDTDAKRAEIVRRYRLYSAQPDEMITFRSLSGMKPGRLKLDPKMYQYGGLWIYPVGGLLKIASLFHLVTLRTDLAFYLDHPGEFARFYVVARSYSAVWGLLGVWVMYRLGREWTGHFLVGATAAALFASMPVVIDLAHEAKPHLAGTVLILLTIWAAMRFARTGQRRWWIIAGGFAGMAMGMVLTGYAAFAVLPVMALLRPMRWAERVRIALYSVLVGVAIFALTNPYFLLNFLFHRELLHSNVGNYGTFYQPRISLPGLISTGRFIVEGMSLGPAMVGGLAVCVLPFVSRRLNRDTGLRPVLESLANQTVPNPAVSSTGWKPVSRCGLLFISPAVLVLIQMVLLAQGKTAEYARFGLLADVAIALAAAVLIGALALKPGEKRMISLLLIGGTLFYGVRYDINFELDSRAESTRRTSAASIDTCIQQSNNLAVWAEPAPYCLPPVDLFRWRILLLPSGTEPTDIEQSAIAVRPVDWQTQLPRGVMRFVSSRQPVTPDSPISWANKPFDILISTRRPVSPPTTRP